MRPTGTPVQSCDDRRDRLLVDARQDERRLALQRRELRLQPGELGEQSLCARSGVSGGWRVAAVVCASAACSSLLPVPSTGSLPLPQLRADLEHAIDELALGVPSAPRARRARALRAASFSSAALPALAPRSTPTASSRPMISELGLQRLDRPAAVLELRRHRVLADGHARAGRVEQADRLVGQLPRRECSDATAARPPRAPRRAPARDDASRASTPRRAPSGSPSPRSARRPARPGSGASAPDPSRCTSCIRPRSSRRSCAACRAPAPA